MPFVFSIAFEKPPGVWQEYTMNEGKTNVIRTNNDLTYPCADWPSALLVKVSETISVGDFSCIWRNRCNDISEFPDDAVYLRRKMFKVFFD